MAKSKLVIRPLGEVGYTVELNGEDISHQISRVELDIHPGNSTAILHFVNVEIDAEGLVEVTSIADESHKYVEASV